MENRAGGEDTAGNELPLAGACGGVTRSSAFSRVTLSDWQQALVAHLLRMWESPSVGVGD